MHSPIHQVHQLANRERQSTENDEPQPQVDVAWGFLIVNPPPVTVSTKSTSAPVRYRMLIGSTNSFTPCDSNTWSPEPWPFSSIIRPYWKPEQPPPCTNTRRPLPALFSSVSNSLILPAAVSETLIMIGISPQESLSLYRMPLRAVPRPNSHELHEISTRRWDDLRAARPDLVPAVDLQQNLLRIVVAAAEAIEGRLPRLSLPPKYL